MLVFLKRLSDVLLILRETLDARDHQLDELPVTQYQNVLDDNSSSEVVTILPVVPSPDLTEAIAVQTNDTLNSLIVTLDDY